MLHARSSRGSIGALSSQAEPSHARTSRGRHDGCRAPPAAALLSTRTRTVSVLRVDQVLQRTPRTPTTLRPRAAQARRDAARDAEGAPIGHDDLVGVGGLGRLEQRNGAPARSAAAPAPARARAARGGEAAHARPIRRERRCRGGAGGRRAAPRSPPGPSARGRLPRSVGRWSNGISLSCAAAEQRRRRPDHGLLAAQVTASLQRRSRAAKRPALASSPAANGHVDDQRHVRGGGGLRDRGERRGSFRRGEGSRLAAWIGSGTAHPRQRPILPARRVRRAK